MASAAAEAKGDQAKWLMWSEENRARLLVLFWASTRVFVKRAHSFLP